jgi:hypothetical protein
MCAELVTICWIDVNGKCRSELASLEDISATGACIHLESPIEPLTIVSLEHPKGRYEGTIKYCTFQDFAYFLGIEFDNGYRWSKTDFKPSHLLELPPAGKAS